MNGMRNWYSLSPGEWRNWWLCPLTIAAVGTKQVVGMATWLLTIRDMMTLFAARRCWRVGHSIAIVA